MKEYKCIVIWKILVAFTLMVMSVCFLYVQPQLSFQKSIIMSAILIFFAFGLVSFFYVKVIVTDIKIEMVFDLKFYKVVQNVEWSKITQIESDYFFFPQIGVIKIKCPSNNNQPKMEIPITFFPFALLENIMRYVPNSANVEIYPWLQKKIKAS